MTPCTGAESKKMADPSTFDESMLPLAIAKMLPSGELPLLASFTDGSQHRVYKAVCANGDAYAARVPLFLGGSNNAVGTALGMEVLMVRKLNEGGFPLAAREVGFDLGFANAARWPFQLVTWAEGAPLRWDDGLPHEVRAKVLQQLALAQVQMIQCTLDDRGAQPGLGHPLGMPKGPASRFFELLTEDRRERARKGAFDYVKEQDCLDQMALLPKVLYPELEDLPAAVAHGDLVAKNIIVDGDHNITGFGLPAPDA
jgi:hypothetical protein